MLYLHGIVAIVPHETVDGRCQLGVDPELQVLDDLHQTRARLILGLALGVAVLRNPGWGKGFGRIGVGVGVGRRRRRRRRRGSYILRLHTPFSIVALDK